MAATTIADLPRDVLVLIFRAVLDDARWDSPAGSRPHEIHKKLRRVCREWRDAADIAYIEYEENDVFLKLRAVRNPAALRARFPSMIHSLSVDCEPVTWQLQPGRCNAPTTALALSSLCASPDLRRVLKRVKLESMCCPNTTAAAVSAIAACANLTSLELDWWRHEHIDGARTEMLTTLSQLTGLKQLKMGAESAWPTLPDCPALTSLALSRSFGGSFAPVGSDACLGRLRSLERNVAVNRAADRWASDDPFGLRAEAWRPHRLTRVQKLAITSLIAWNGLPVGWEPRVYDGATPAAAVWALLAPTVTELELLTIASICHDSDLETGMYAGLGALTGLQALVVETSDEQRCPVDFGSIHCPRLTNLCFIGYRGPPIDLSRFPRLVIVYVAAEQGASPVALASVAALRRLKTLRVSGQRHVPDEPDLKPRLNLAQLFGAGRPLAALEELSFRRVILSWDAAAAPGALSASEFADDPAALLPSLWLFEIGEDVEMDEDVGEFVVPAMTYLDTDDEEDQEDDE